MPHLRGGLPMSPKGRAKQRILDGRCIALHTLPLTPVPAAACTMLGFLPALGPLRCYMLTLDPAHTDRRYGSI